MQIRFLSLGLLRFLYRLYYLQCCRFRLKIKIGENNGHFGQ